MGTLWADIDAKLWPAAADPLATARAAVESCALAATALVCTGGGFHVYWRLAEPANLGTPGMRVRIETLNRALAHAVVGPTRAPDHVQDVARILRVPGSLNHKDAPPHPVAVVWLRPERAYTLDTLTAVLQEQAPWTLQAVAVARPSRWSVPGVVCAPARPRTVCPVPEGLRRFAQRGVAAGQRNNAAFWLACRLVQAGASADDAWTVLQTFAVACSPPLDERELQHVWRSAQQAQPSRPRGRAPGWGQLQVVSRPRTRPYRAAQRPLTRPFVLVTPPLTRPFTPVEVGHADVAL